MLHKNKKEVVIFCGYRSWAKNIYSELKKKYNNFNWYSAENPEQLQNLLQIKEVKIVILAGWSWIIAKDIVEKYFMVGLHPSDLPNYAGGSPIQNQVLDGIENTKMSLFKVSPEIDKGEILYKSELSLSGGMDNIFKNLTLSSIQVLDLMLTDYPNILLHPQSGNGKSCRRLKPRDSKIDFPIKNMTVKQLYDFIRCREDPYPNVYMEDDTGTLYFKKVDFVQKEVKK